MNIREIRAKYPQYNDLSDEQLAKGFYKKFYSDMDYNDFANKIGLVPELSDNGIQPMSAQQKQQAEDMAAKIRPQKSLGDKTAEFMVTNPFSRQLGFALQGASNAALNPFGYVARAAGVDTEPLEAQNAMERITELAGKYGYDTGAFTSGLTGLAEAGVGGAGLTGNVIKALAAGGQPVAQTGSLGSAALTGFVNPETETGKFATDVLGGMAAAPLGQVVDKSVRSLAPKRIQYAISKIN